MTDDTQHMYTGILGLLSVYQEEKVECALAGGRSLEVLPLDSIGEHGVADESRTVHSARQCGLLHSQATRDCVDHHHGSVRSEDDQRAYDELVGNMATV